MAGYDNCGCSGLSAPAVNHTDQFLKQSVDKRLAVIRFNSVHFKNTTIHFQSSYD